ncbi:hypothetical protein CH63R_02931 [Colletotrichum higginsianum IMI 349063]|uniref:Uncharacterized protein n=2 Tax=Colletotrichum higginsianum (strain IMI 349063) TaxID=759273 RepID=A0A1B7YQ84_COLHI|nr:hypothetical protein CH63R_02931 [Colletotrichum higginsianum IMI 349063]OBR14205.1 hypothetical protein CH63R_02931 [Colletotrichum higginsianum IMI 349063]
MDRGHQRSRHATARHLQTPKGGGRCLLRRHRPPTCTMVGHNTERTRVAQHTTTCSSLPLAFLSLASQVLAPESPVLHPSDRPSLVNAKRGGMKDSANLPSLESSPDATCRGRSAPSSCVFLIPHILAIPPPSQSEATPGRPPLFQGPASQLDARAVLPCTGRCPKSERLQIFMPQGGMHQ